MNQDSGGLSKRERRSFETMSRCKEELRKRALVLGWPEHYTLVSGFDMYLEERIQPWREAQAWWGMHSRSAHDLGREIATDELTPAEVSNLMDLLARLARSKRP